MDTFIRQIELDSNQISLLNKHKIYGFKNENALIYYAFTLLQKEINKKTELEKSAELYAEIYEEDEELQFLTEAALNDIEL